MNKGYADFTKIDVINSNKEYSIVESQSMYDLQVYDYIVLDGDGVNDSDFVTDTDLKNGNVVGYKYIGFGEEPSEVNFNMLIHRDEELPEGKVNIYLDGAGEESAENPAN